MLSRVADSLFWIGRYVERAENVARFIDVNYHLLLDLPAGYGEQWEPLVSTTGDQEAFARKYGRTDKENVLQFLAFDPDNPNSILSCLTQARRNARSVREVISSEMWEQLNKFYLMVSAASMQSFAGVAPHAFFADVKEASHLFQGISDATLSRGQGWHFLTIGRNIERSDKTTRILDVKYFILLPEVSLVGSPFDDIHWSAVLRSASGFEMYRKRHGRINAKSVVDFLVLDREFPRAILFCMRQAEESLHAITGVPLTSFATVAEQKLGTLAADLAYEQVDRIFDEGLHEYLDRLQVRINEVGTAIDQTFFARQPQ